MFGRFLIVFVILVWPFHFIIGQNLVSNPGFESGATNWSALSATISNTSSGTHSGTNALKIVTSIGVSLYQQLSNVPPPHCEYRLSAWMKSASNIVIKMGVHANNGDGIQFNARTADKLLSTNWTNITLTFKFVPAATTTSFLVEFLYFDVNALTNTFFLDDVSLTNLAPRLTFAGISSNHAVFEWSANAGYLLYSTTNLAMPDWIQAFGDFDFTNDLIRIYIPTNGQNNFFRLDKF